MANASYFEDIQERRSSKQALIEENRIARQALEQARSYSEIRNPQERVRNLAEQVANDLARSLDNILAAFDAYERSLKNPHINVIARIEKIEKENQRLRAKEKDNSELLAKCRKNSDNLSKKIRELEVQNRRLSDELGTLRAKSADHDAWQAATKGANVIKK